MWVKFVFDNVYDATVKSKKGDEKKKWKLIYTKYTEQTTRARQYKVEIHAETRIYCIQYTCLKRRQQQAYTMDFLCICGFR